MKTFFGFVIPPSAHLNWNCKRGFGAGERGERIRKQSVDPKPIYAYMYLIFLYIFGVVLCSADTHIRCM